MDWDLALAPHVADCALKQRRTDLWKLLVQLCFQIIENRVLFARPERTLFFQDDVAVPEVPQAPMWILRRLGQLFLGHLRGCLEPPPLDRNGGIHGSLAVSGVSAVAGDCGRSGSVSSTGRSALYSES